MGRGPKILKAATANPNGVTFSELRYLVESAGFTLARMNGDHHIFTRPGVAEIINIQPKGNSAKPYQVRQVLDLIDKYKINIP